MRAAIYGAGSLGTVLGAYVSKNGLAIDLISRNTAHIASLKEHGARITGTVNMIVPVTALLPEEMLGKYDVIFLMTKQADNPKTVRSLIPYLEDDGAICTMQNGLPETAIAKVLGENRTFGCAIAWGAALIGAGACELRSEPDSLTFCLGSCAESADIGKIKLIKGILELMGPVEVENNFIGARWSKLLVNCSFSGMSTVLGCTFGEAAKNKASRLCVQRIIKECIDVAQKADIKIEPIQGKDIRILLDYKTKTKEAFSFALLPIVIKKHSLLKASMLQDVEKGRKCEIDFINGIACEYGKKYEVATPYNDKVVAIVHELERGERIPRFDNVLLFDGLR